MLKNVKTHLQILFRIGQLQLFQQWIQHNSNFPCHGEQIYNDLQGVPFPLDSKCSRHHLSALIYLPLDQTKPKQKTLCDIHNIDHKILNTFHNVDLIKSNIFSNLVSRLPFLSRTKYKSISLTPTLRPRLCNLKCII